MRVRVSAILLLLVFLVAVTAGCGGGDNQSNQSGGESQGDGKTKSQGGGKTKKGRAAKEVTTVEGTLGRIALEEKRITLRPDSGGEPLSLRFNPEVAKVTVGGEEASAEALESRSRAEVQYFEREGGNREGGNKVARQVNVTSDAPPGADPQSGGPTG